MTLTAPIATDTPDAFCSALHAWLLIEADQQALALRWTDALGQALISANTDAIQQAQEALHRWEVDHLPQLESHRRLESQWDTLAGSRPFNVSAVVAWLQEAHSDSDWEWQLAEVAGRLQMLVRSQSRQQELNRLLIAQHADILQQTWALFAQVLTGTNAEDRRYDDLGQMHAVPAGATLLDARG